MAATFALAAAPSDASAGSFTPAEQTLQDKLQAIPGASMSIVSPGAARTATDAFAKKLGADTLDKEAIAIKLPERGYASKLRMLLGAADSSSTRNEALGQIDQAFGGDKTPFVYTNPGADTLYISRGDIAKMNGSQANSAWNALVDGLSKLPGVKPPITEADRILGEATPRDPNQPIRPRCLPATRGPSCGGH